MRSALEWSSVFLLLLTSLVSITEAQSRRRGDQCENHSQCESDERCVGQIGTCNLPKSWSGERPVYCQRSSQCKDRVRSSSRCKIDVKGTCLPRSSLCRDEDRLWVETCPRSQVCDESQNCVRRRRGQGGDDDSGAFSDRCSARRPCPRGRTCCSDGRCSRSRSCTCARSNPDGSCPLGEYCESRRGDCRKIKCSSSRQCPDFFSCLSGTCQRDDDHHDDDYRGDGSVEFPDRRGGSGRCSPRNRYGYCERSGYECNRDGRCVRRANDRPCSRSNRDGYCQEEDEVCDEARGRCVSDRCSSSNEYGYCPRGEYCQRGRCVDDRDSDGSFLSPLSDRECSRINLNGFCRRRDEYCNRDGVCVRDDDDRWRDGGAGRDRDRCSERNRNGYCQRSYECRDGHCVFDERYDQRDRCSRSNPYGYCDRQKYCRDGFCERETECDSRNWYGYCRRSDEVCNRGRCVPERDMCSSTNSRGFCPPGQECSSRRGRCEVVDSFSRDRHRDDDHHDDDRYDDGDHHGHFDDARRCEISSDCDRDQVCRRRRCRDTCSRSRVRDSCHRDEICVRGACEKEEVIHHGHFDDARRCEISSDCDRDQVCRRRRCRDTCSRSRVRDSCHRDEICVRGACEKEEVIHDHLHETCRSDRDCHNGQECLRERCVDVPCSDDHPHGRCGQNRTCRRGVCVVETYLGTSLEITTDVGDESFGSGVIVAAGN